MDKVVVLLSGGMDSVTALYHCQQQFSQLEAISFDYGSKHNAREIPFARYHCEKLGIPHRVVQMTFLNELFDSSLLQSGDDVPEGHYASENMKSTVVPFRNGIMLSVAGGLAENLEFDGVCIAAHSGDHHIYPDCRTDFMEAMSEALRLGTYATVKVYRPFVDIDKTEILRRGHGLKIDFAKTWSCYKGRELHCGKCGTCVERKEAFKLAGIPDPTVYQDDIADS